MSLVSAQTETTVAYWFNLLYIIVNAVPQPREWLNANRLFEHPRGCRCSTCELAAGLAAYIRFKEGMG